MSVDVVAPTAGRRSLGRLLGALDSASPAFGGRVIVVDDRRRRDEPLAVDGRGAEVMAGPARGPAAARNAGWRASRAQWIVFLDDDVVPPPDWPALLEDDLAAAADDVAGVQGGVEVPLPASRRPSDWERNVAGLEGARWATADLAYRRGALEAAGGFDERFGRAYREDADLGLRLVRAGWRIERGRRHVVHPVGPAGRWVSLRLQAGNADDRLMDALHGRGWREQAGAPRGRLRRHLATAGAGAATLPLAAARRPRASALAAALWLAGVGELARERIAPGPRTGDELVTVVLTSALMPTTAAAHAARGLARAQRLKGAGPQATGGPSSLPAAVLLDRDGTLVRDVRYNGDPAHVQPMPGAREALDRLRAAGVPMAVVSNQSAIGRGLLSHDQVEAVNRRVEELLGPIGPWLLCPHAPDAGCRCRKPAPGLVLRAAEALGVPADRCALIGDIGADVEAARSAGARPILVPTSRTRPEEVRDAREIAPDLPTAVTRILEGAR